MSSGHSSTNTVLGIRESFLVYDRRRRVYHCLPFCSMPPTSGGPATANTEEQTRDNICPLNLEDFKMGWHVGRFILLDLKIRTPCKHWHHYHHQHRMTRGVVLWNAVNGQLALELMLSLWTASQSCQTETYCRKTFSSAFCPSLSNSKLGFCVLNKLNISIHCLPMDTERFLHHFFSSSSNKNFNPHPLTRLTAAHDLLIVCTLSVCLRCARVLLDGWPLNYWAIHEATMSPCRCLIPPPGQGFNLCVFFGLITFERSISWGLFYSNSPRNQLVCSTRWRAWLLSQQQQQMTR